MSADSLDNFDSEAKQRDFSRHRDCNEEGVIDDVEEFVDNFVLIADNSNIIKVFIEYEHNFNTSIIILEGN